jgi:hypothetical protein
MARDKQRLLDRQEQKKKMIEERKQQITERSNPYEKEMDTCDHLIAYLNKMKV